jgi:cytidine deaminase
MTDKELYLIAESMLPRSYAPFSEFHVGAALLTAKGEVFTGVNVENSSLGGTICAERTAFVKAISEGSSDVRAIAVACDKGEALPCGICRQFMYEFGDDLRIITGTDSEHIRVHTITELLPQGFRLRPEHKGD